MRIPRSLTKALTVTARAPGIYHAAVASAEPSPRLPAKSVCAVALRTTRPGALLPDDLQPEASAPAVTLSASQRDVVVARGEGADIAAQTTGHAQLELGERAT